MNIGNLLIAILIVVTSLTIWGVYGWPPFKENVGELGWDENWESGNGMECGTGMWRDQQES